MNADLNELLERVRSATGPDREIDVALLHLWEPSHEALCSYDQRYQTELRDGVFSVWKTDGGYSASVPFPRFTASVDAALALCERVLPGWKWNIGHDANDDLHAMVWHGVTEHDEYGSTAPLTILAALLSVLISKGGQP